MSHIAPTAAKGINADERAVIESYDFDLYDDNGHFKLLDNIIRATDKKAGQYTGGNMRALLNKAIAARKAHTTANPNSATVPPAPAKAATGAGQKGALPGLKGKAMPNAGGPKAGKGKTVAEAVAESPKTDPDEITGAELDNTGKRERKSRKVTGPKVKKENRYKRAAKTILANPTIDAKELAKLAGFSASAGAYCLEAFAGITEALVEAKLMKPVAATKTPPTTGK